MNRRDALTYALGAATAAAAAPAAAKAAPARTLDLAAARKLQDSTLLVDGLDPSGLTERYLGMLEKAGVDVWNQSMGGFPSFVNLLRFIDKYQDRIVQVKSVKDMRAAWKAGKVGHLSSWQSSETLVRDGDPIELDVAARSLRLVVDDAEIAARRAAWTPPPPHYERGYGLLWAGHVGQADRGCDFDFLAGSNPTAEPEIH